MALPAGILPLRLTVDEACFLMGVSVARFYLHQEHSDFPQIIQDRYSSRVYIWTQDVFRYLAAEKGEDPSKILVYGSPMAVPLGHGGRSND